MVNVNNEGFDGQYVHEEIRKVCKNNLPRTLKANGAYSLARHVDEQPLINCQLSLYGQYRNNLNRTVPEIDDSVQKARSRYGSGYQVGEIPLTQSFEEMYFNLYGTGLDGSPYPTMIGQGYTCQCGLKFGMSPKMMPPNCPICGRITPLGRFIKDGYYKK